METAVRDKFIMLRLDHGEDILDSINKAVMDERSTMLVVTGLGMISDFELGYFDHGKYIKRAFREPHELLALQGSIASKGEPRVHIHATVANAEHEAFGGHLMRGRAWMSNEIGIVRLPGVVSTRTLDLERNVGILHFQ